MFSRPILQDTPTAARCEVFRPNALRVHVGVNAGDDLASPDVPFAGDIYRLDRAARPALVRLTAPGPDGLRRIGLGSGIGHAGQAVAVAARLVFMAADGLRAEVLVLRPLPCDGATPETLLLPLHPLVPGMDLTLIRIDATPGPGPCRLPELACGMLGRGTRVLIADGTPRPVERLRPGDRVLTRDHGAQPLRWARQVTLRAAGPLSPVAFPRGTLGAAGDLKIGQHSRLFLYRRDPPSPSAAPVQARHLLAERGILLHEGGLADYVVLVFDAHEIVYAEGLAVESLQVTPAVLERLPAILAEEIADRFPGLDQPCHFVLDMRPPGLDADWRGQALPA
jgi:hypothetical protein